MRKTIAILLFFNFYLITLFSNAVWADPIPDDQKAGILFDFINSEYKKQTRSNNIEYLRYLKTHASWIRLLDNSRKNDVKRLKENIKRTIKNIIDGNLKKARYYIRKKWYISAGMQYTYLKKSVPFNKEATKYIKDHKEDIDNYIKAKKESTKKLIKNKKYITAEKEIKQVLKLHSYDLSALSLLNICNAGKRQKFNKHLWKAKANLRNKKYEEALTNARIALKYDPYSKETKKIINESYSKTFTEGYTKSDSSDYISHYYKASRHYQNNEYRKARVEILKYLKNTNDKKGYELARKINNELVEELLDEAIFNYNSQEYEEALNLFNEILLIRPKNDIALDYKSRLEKRIKAFD